MTGNETLSSSEKSSNAQLEHAIALLSQQCWCWGRDILRPQGNWLVELGFERIEPPLRLKDRGSVYQLSLPDDRLLILRGFGVLFGKVELGGIFLPRFEFTPRYTELDMPVSPPWTSAELPCLEPLNVSNRNQCISLTLELIDWIHSYEVNIVEQLGLDYRSQTLIEWDDGTRHVIPARLFASAWQQLSCKIADDQDVLFA